MRNYLIDIRFQQMADLTLDKVRQAAAIAVDNGLDLYFTVRHDLVPRADLDRVVAEVKYRRYAQDQWSVDFPASPRSLGPGIGSFTARQIDYRTNQFVAGGLLDFKFGDDRHLISPYAQEMLRLAKLLYPVLQPRLGWIDNTDRCDIDFRDIDKLRLPKIGWVSFFSPAYVAHYGERFFADLPAYHIETLPDGGVLVQLTPSILAPDKATVRQVRTAVQEHCAAHGLKTRCCAPYFIEDALITSACEPVDPELHTYLRQHLDITLLLEDGARLKVIHVRWANLNTTERGVAMTAIRNRLDGEMKAHPGVPWRIEINEIPPELERLLAGLPGRHGSAVQWVTTG